MPEQIIIETMLKDMWKKPSRSPDRIPDVMSAIQGVWARFPDWRFGQLISNIMDYSTKKQFFIEDNDFMLALDLFFKEHFPDLPEK
jgi:hypothetical protein